jgi:hypothetical protein
MENCWKSKVVGSRARLGWPFGSDGLKADLKECLEWKESNVGEKETHRYVLGGIG